MAIAKSGLKRPSSQVSPTELPTYIIERNQAATAAGLIIEKQERCGNRLTTWYRGTEQQWRATPFCKRPANSPFTRSPMNTGFDCFTLPHHYGGLVLYRKGNDDYRGSVSELLPEWVEDAGDGITAYGIADSVIYVGRPAALIARKIAPPEIETDAWGRAPGYDPFHQGPVIWEYHELEDGRGWFRDFVAERERSARREADKNKHSLSTASELVEFWSQATGGCARVLFDHYKRSQNKAGKAFIVAQESLDEINEVLAELIAAIRGAHITVRDADPRAIEIRECAGRAKADRTFQAFMSQAIKRET